MDLRDPYFNLLKIWTSSDFFDSLEERGVWNLAEDSMLLPLDTWTDGPLEVLVILVQFL